MPNTAAIPPGSAVPMALTVNGRRRSYTADLRVTLLDALRRELNFTGAKKGCDHGQCGACTVLVDGRRVLACLTLAAAVGDRPVTTIEGLSDGDTLHPMQQAFVDHDALQYGELSFIAPDRDGLHIGARARMSDVAGHPAVLRDYPVVAESLQQAASAQLRNMATMAGNLLQRTRCAYFRDTGWTRDRTRAAGLRTAPRACSTRACSTRAPSTRRSRRGCGSAT